MPYLPETLILDRGFIAEVQYWSRADMARYYRFYQVLFYYHTLKTEDSRFNFENFFFFLL